MMRNLDWIDLAQDRDSWEILENTVTKFLVPEYTGLKNYQLLKKGPVPWSLFVSYLFS